MKQISLIIVTFESSALIQECLDSVFQFNDLTENLEVIVVDNGSSDQGLLFDLISKHYDNRVKCIASPGNVGYGAGNNLGVLHSSASRIVIMNPDVRLVEPVFAQLISFFDHNPETGMASVSFADESCPFFVKPEHYNLWNLLTFKKQVKRKNFNSRKTYLPGSFLMFDKNVFEAVGMFDENIFLYFEEADISNRIERYGKKIRRIDELKVFHLTHDRKLNEGLIKIEIDSLSYYARKFGYGLHHVIGNYLLVNRMKLFAARLINDLKKIHFFQTWIKLLKQKLNETDS